MTKRRWRSWEVGLMLQRYPGEGSAPLRHALARSIDAITSQARRLRLPSPGRRQRQALSRARGNCSVNVEFFKALSEPVAFVLGFIWARGSVRTRPRHVLRLRCPRAKEDELLAVRALLGSRHHVQRRGGHTVCDVCSYCLVQDLVRQYGPPPSAEDPDPPLPRLPAEYHPHLARGLFVGGGQVDESRITWVGTGRAIGELEALIRAATGISSPEKKRLGKSHSLSWHTPDELRTLSEWLRLGVPALAEDASKGNFLSSLPGAL
jgi:hypothetical protein